MHYLEKRHGRAVGTSSGADGMCGCLHAPLVLYAKSGWFPRLAVISLFALLVVPWEGCRSREVSAMGLSCERAEETLGSKPSGLCPKPEDLAKRPCNTAVLPGTAAGTTSARPTSNQIGGPPSLAPREQDVPRPRCGAPLSSPPRGMFRGARLAMRVTQSNLPVTRCGLMCLAHACVA